MRAVVVEIRGSKAAVLSDSGEVKLIRNRNYSKGQVIQVKEELAFGSMSGLRMASALVAALLVITLGVSSYAYFTPVATVSLDVNPSLLFNLNRFERVLSYEGIGDAGQQIANQIKIKNKSVDEAIMLALQQMKQDGYLGESDQNGVMISAAFKNAGQEQAFAARLKAAVQGELEDLEIEAEVEAEGVGYERVQAARDLGLTPGKLNLLEKLQESAEDEEEYAIDEWREMSVKEIMLEIRDNRMKEKDLPPGQIKQEDNEGPGNSNQNSKGKGN